MAELRIVRLITRLEGARVLDPLIRATSAAVAATIRSPALRDLLHGVPFGHPLHPVAVQVPIGAFTSAAVLDALPERLAPGARRLSRFFVGVGVLSVLPAVAAGWTDWLRLHDQHKRVGIIHAAANAAAVALYGASFVLRGRGTHGAGKGLALGGFALLSAAGFLGGHLAYRQAAGANHAEHVPHLFPSGWQRLGHLEDLVDDELRRMDIAGQPLLVLRRGASVQVLSNTCSHLSAPLNEGGLVDAASDDPCVTCPWHGSVFAMRTGEVVHGPATSPQPRFETRVVFGLVEVLLPDAG